MWEEITYSFPNFKGYSIEICEWISNFIYILLGMWLLIHDWTKAKPGYKVSPGYEWWR